MDSIDSTKVAVAAIIVLGALIMATMGFVFVSDHWEDIKTMAIIALALGGTFTLVVGGIKLKSGR